MECSLDGSSDVVNFDKKFLSHKIGAETQIRRSFRLQESLRISGGRHVRFEWDFDPWKASRPAPLIFPPLKQMLSQMDFYLYQTQVEEYHKVSIC